MKVIELILVLFLVSVALYNFELYDFNKWLVSILLLLSAAGLIFKAEEFQRFIRNSSWLVLAILIIKVVFFG